MEFDSRDVEADLIRAFKGRARSAHGEVRCSGCGREIKEDNYSVSLMGPYVGVVYGTETVYCTQAWVRLF